MAWRRPSLTQLTAMKEAAKIGRSRESSSKSQTERRKIPVKKFCPNKKEKNRVFLGIYLGAKQTNKKKSCPRVVNGIAPRTKNCQKAPLIKDTQFLRSETAVNPQKTDRNSGSPFFIVRSVCLSDPPSAETGCLRVCHCNLMLWLKQNGVRLLHLELVVVGH